MCHMHLNWQAAGREPHCTNRGRRGTSAECKLPNGRFGELRGAAWGRQPSIQAAQQNEGASPKEDSDFGHTRVPIRLNNAIRICPRSLRALEPAHGA